MAKFTTEKDVKRQVKNLLNKHNWFWWMPAANGYGKSGVSDFCAVKAGVFLGVETKANKNKPTANQIAFLTSIQTEGCFGFVVNEERVDVLRQWLEAFDQSVDYVSKKQVPPDEAGALLIDCMRVMTQELP